MPSRYPWPFLNRLKPGTSSPAAIKIPRFINWFLLYRPKVVKMGTHILEKNQKAKKAIIPIQKDVSHPIKIAPIKPITIEMIEKIARTELDAITAASIGPRLWLNQPQPLINDPNSNNKIPNTKWLLL